MVSTNYLPCFQPLPSQEVRVVPYIEPPFAPTVGKLFLTCNQYTAQNEDGIYTVSVNLLRDEEGITIEYVSNGNLFMRVKIIREKLLSFQSRHEYFLLSNKYHELFLDHHRHLNEKIKAEWKIKEAEWKREEAEWKIKEAECEREYEERRLNLQRIHEEAMNHPIFIVGYPFILFHDFVTTHATNTAIVVKDITQNALIATGDTVVKTARVAKENISKLVFFCSYALVRVKPSAGVGHNCDMQRHVDSGKPIQFYFQSPLEHQKIFKQASQNTSCPTSLIAQLLYNEKKD